MPETCEPGERRPRRVHRRHLCQQRNVHPATLCGWRRPLRRRSVHRGG
jgi:hypothetical protein